MNFDAKLRWKKLLKCAARFGKIVLSIDFSSFSKINVPTFCVFLKVVAQILKTIAKYLKLKRYVNNTFVKFLISKIILVKLLQ